MAKLTKDDVIESVPFEYLDLLRFIRVYEKWVNGELVDFVILIDGIETLPWTSDETEMVLADMVRLRSEFDGDNDKTSFRLRSVHTDNNEIDIFVLDDALGSKLSERKVRYYSG